MVRSLFGRRPCKLAHARQGAWLLRRVENSRPTGMVSQRDQKQPRETKPPSCATGGRSPRKSGALGIDPAAWPEYLSLHLAALSGWAGFIKWRADQSEYEWQTAYPIDLVQYLAVRLWYERELVQSVCRKALGIDGNADAISAEMQKRGVPLSNPAGGDDAVSRAPLINAWRLVALARALELEPALLTQTQQSNLRLLLDWMDGFPETEHGPVWLKAFETGYQEQLLDKLRLKLRPIKSVSFESESARASGTRRIAKREQSPPSGPSSILHRRSLRAPAAQPGSDRRLRNFRFRRFLCRRHPSSSPRQPP